MWAISLTQSNSGIVIQVAGQNMTDDDIVKEFLTESFENLDQLDQDFVALEKERNSPERLASIFRTIHTIKGTCGYLGFSKLEHVTHGGENLLSKLRDGKLHVSSDIVSGLLAMVDAVREILGNIEKNGQEGDGDYTAIVENIARISAENAPAEAPAPAAPSSGSAAMEAAPVPAVEVAAPEPAPTADEPAAVAVAAPEKGDAEEHDGAADKAPTSVAKPGESSASGIRVDVALLDKLMNLVGELVLARNQIVQFSVASENAALTGSTQRLNLITTELQEGVMKTRMQPIGNVWSKFPRVVRDIAQVCGKRVRVDMEGKETELDKTIIEAIKDPLTHIIRNSVDHGIETPGQRRAAGKNEEGRLFLRAFHEGGQVNIEIADDGAGVNVDRVRKKALEKGLITPEQANRLTEREATNLIFLPGFSTADKVTNVSGRGVGMDVVKTNIEKIGGTVDVQSKTGAGTTLRIRIPLTLAIIPALIITSGGDRFAIPQVSLLELVRLEEEQAKAGVEMVHGTPVYRLRGNLLPLVYLNRELGAAGAKASGVVNIVVLQAEEQQFGLVVDEINDTEEIVVKPLGKLFKGLTTFAGATIMGDGKVALILDVMGLAQKSGVISHNKDRSVMDDEGRHSQDAAKSHSLLLFRISDTQRMAIPLSQVARLEEFSASKIETSGNQQVIQYRGRIMPLLSLADAVGGKAASAGPKRDSDTVQVIVHTWNDMSVGLVVDRIVDIVDEALSIQRTSIRPGVLGSAIIDKKVTELLDVEAVVRPLLADPAGAGGKAAA
ncbi:MAG TPA: chemotaxis protein CheA [Phycisphaerae bacterium]|nr:chemotaxis protein CheA [Phycisphaerae bacterium]